MSNHSVSPNTKLSLLTEEEIEPYVRKKKCSGESRKKMMGLNDDEQNILRTSINSRERKRMHDLNDAHEELRSCLPYGQEANARKLSKISTIMLASNWIRQLTKENARLTAENEALRRQITSPCEPAAATVPTTQPAQSVQPVAAMLATGFPIHCMRTFGQPCFCVGCMTLMAKKETTG